MHLLLEMNRWHFKNSLCLQFTVKIKPHHHFQRWQWDSSARVFLGWQTPALIQAWMMSSIHYTMIESLPPRPSVASLLWTKHSSKAPPRLFLAKRWERERERAGMNTQHATTKSGALWVKTRRPGRCVVTCVLLLLQLKRGEKRAKQNYYRKSEVSIKGWLHPKLKKETPQMTFVNAIFRYFHIWLPLI